MKTVSEVQLELSKLGHKNRLFGRAEVKELARVLADGEIIVSAVNGRYENGFCFLVATDRRLLLLDKKVWFLSLEDVRFDMISEVDYCARLLDATLSVRTINKVLRFTAIKKDVLRELTSYLQARVMELRHTPAYAQPMPNLQSYSYGFQPSIQSLQSPVTTQQFQQTSQPSADASGLYSAQISEPARASHYLPKRIGAYPTASLTVHRVSRN